MSDVPTRLRQIADARAIDVALAACLIGLLPAFVAAGLVSGFAADAALPAIILIVVGVLLATLGVLMLHRARTRLPRERTRIVRGPGSAWQGIVAFVVIVGVLLFPFGGGALAMASENPRASMLLVGVGVGIAVVLLVADVFIVPGVILGRARRSLRAAAYDDAQYRMLLEQDRLSWHPSGADMAYGPL